MSEWLDEVAVPNDEPLSQLIYATVVRSAETYQAISHMIGCEFDTQGGMLCRPPFEDMVIAHWLDYNQDDADWLVRRFFHKRDAMALVQEGWLRRAGTLARLSST